MSEILFRGKTPSEDEYFDDGEWVTGFYTCFNGKEHRIYSGYAETDCADYYPDWCNVRSETVGQYTGLTDKNGKKIFEGDILKGAWETVLTIFFDEISSSYRVKTSTGHEREPSYYGIDKWEVIGNIHDNPELLKGGDG